MKNNIKKVVSILTAAVLMVQLLTVAVIADDLGSQPAPSATPSASEPSEADNSSAMDSVEEPNESGTTSEESSTSSAENSSSSAGSSSEAVSSGNEGSSSSSEDETDSSVPPAETVPPDNMDDGTASQAPQIILAYFAPLAQEQAKLSIKAGTPFEEISLPSSLEATDIDGIEQTVSGVTWNCPSYHESEAIPGNQYTVKAVLPDEYQLANGVRPPEIRLTISGPSGRAINDRIIIGHAIYKEINPTEAKLIGYEKTDGVEVGELVIPAQITNPIDGHVLTVISVEDSAFQNCDTITSVKFEGNPTIGSYAFAGSKIKSIDFGSELDNLGSYAFSDCAALSSVTIPGKIKSLTQYAFTQSGLQNVVLEDGVQVIENHAFFACEKLAGVTFPESLNSIGTNAFTTCKALKEITLPGSLYTFDNAFNNSGLEKVTLSEGIKTISPKSFYDCTNLKEVILPSTAITIGPNAFYNCANLSLIQWNEGLQSVGPSAFALCKALTKISLPKSVTNIGYSAFESCTTLKEIYLPDGLKTIGYYAFSNNLELTAIKIPETVVLDNDSYGIFYECAKLEEVILPNNLTTLPQTMFYNCKSLKQVTIPQAVTYLGYAAFQGCTGLTEIEIPDSVTQTNSQVFAGCTNLTTVKLPPNLTFISNQLFSGCANLQEIVLPEKITTIIRDSFSHTGLKKIIIPASVKSIEMDAFYNCQALTEITLNSAEVTLAASMVSDCPALEKVTVNGKIISIGLLAFPNNNSMTISVPDQDTAKLVCDSGISPEKILINGQPSGLDPTVFEVDGLKYSRIPSTDGELNAFVSGYGNAPVDLVIPAEVTYNNRTYKVEEIGKNAFYAWNALKSVTISEGIVTVGEQAFLGCSGLTQVNLPNSIKNLKSSAFQSCSSLKEIVIPNGIETLGNKLFYLATSLESVTLPETLTSIGSQAFWSCKALKKISLPQGLNSIDSEAFSACRALEEITLPDNLAGLGFAGFSGCTALKTIRIPSSIKTLSGRLFEGCTNLSSVNLQEGLLEIGYNCFANTSQLKSISLPKGLQTIGEYAFERSGLDAVEIPEGTTTINPYAFKGCSSLKSISFPSTLKSIMHYAFSNCINLETLEIPENVTVLGQYAFSNCEKLKKAVIKGDVSAASYYYGYSYFTPQGAFMLCTALEEVTLSGSAPDVLPQMFDRCYSLKTVNLSDGIDYIGANAFEGCTGLDKIALPDAVEFIGSNAFNGCTGLVKITLPKQLYSIENGAFQNCTSLSSVTMQDRVALIGENAFSNTALGSVTIPDSTTDIRAMAFSDCPKLAWAKIGKGVYYIGKNAFPANTKLIANDPRVQLLLVEYLNQDGRPTSEWDGQSNVAPGAIVDVIQDVLIQGSVTISEKAEVTLNEKMTVSGTLNIQGKFAVKGRGRLILLDGGQIIGPGAKDLPIYYPLLIPEWELGIVTASSPYYMAGETVKLDIKPASGCSLKANTLCCNGTALTPDADGIYSFQMPARTANITAEFEAGLRIEGKDSSIVSGQSAVYHAVFPADVVSEGAVYHWTVDDRLGAVTLANADSPEVTVTANNIPDDIDAILQVTATVKGKALTAERKIRILAIKSIRINEIPPTPFRPGETLQLTAMLGNQAASGKQILWTSRTQSVASIDENGLVSFRGVGDALISAASTANPKLIASVQLHVVLDAAGTLSFADGGIGSYRSIEVQKDGKPYKTVNTDARGAFTLNALEIGTYTLQSTPYTPGYDSLNQSFYIREGESQSAWKLQYPKCATGSISYSFKDSTGAPVSGVRVAVTCDEPFQSFLDFSRDDGKGQIKELSYASAGTKFHLTYTTNDGGFGNEVVILKSGESAKDLHFELPRISTITGRVTDLNGTGISGLCVQAGLRSAYTNSSGTYSIRGQLDKGTYRVAIAPWEKFFATGAAPEIAVTGDSDVQVEPIRATMGIGVGGKVLLDGRTDSYQKAYVMLYSGSGELIAGGYALGADGFGLEGVIRQTGEYLLKINQIYDRTGWYSVDYDSESVRFTVSSLSQERIVVDLKASSRLKTSEIFRGAGNSLTANTQLAQAGGKIELTTKYKNYGTQTVTAVFDTELSGARVDPNFTDGEFGQLRHIVTVKPGESGSFLIKTLANDTGMPTASAEIKVTVNGQAFDFAKLSVDVANVTLKTDAANLAVGQSFRVYGEAAPNSKIIVFGADSMVLGMTTVGADSGRWYTMKLKGFEKEGTYRLAALSDTKLSNEISEIAESDELVITVSSNPVKLEKVTVDQLDYEDLPINARVGVRSFSHMLDASLVPEPLSIRSAFSGGDRVSAVTYHFADNSYPAKKDEQGRWFANIDHWRGTGIKQLTASVKVDGQNIQFNIAEVTVLIDPSGRVFDADTGRPLAGAQVSCLMRNEDGESYTLWDSARHGQAANPWKTGENGSYGWYVPDGVYQIDVEKSGYESAASTGIEKYREGIHVAPPALDVDFALVPTTEMKLVSLRSLNGKISAQFTRYVKSAEAAVYSEDGTKTVCNLKFNGETIEISGDGLVNGKSYTVELQKVTPKSGNMEKYGLERVTGTVVYNAQRQSQTGTSSGSSSAGGGILSGIVSTLKLSQADVRNAVRENGNAVVKMSGPEPKVSGSTLAKALQALRKDEKLVLRQTQKNLAYQFTIDPAKITQLPNVINFGVSIGHSKTERLFGKYFSNPMQVINCKQEGSYGFRGELAVKVDLKKMSLDKLHVYTYDPKSNRYSELLTAAPVVDANGYLHLNLDAGGILLISDGPLTKK